MGKDMICGHGWASPQFPLFIVFCFSWIKALSAHSDRCGAMGCGVEGEVAKLVSLGCTAWTASLPVHEATGYRSRQQWPPTPGEGGGAQGLPYTQ